MSRIRDIASMLTASSSMATDAEVAASYAPLSNPIFTGNVGIGTSSPTSKLHVETSGTNYITSRNGAAGAGIAGLILQNSGDTRGIRINGSSLEIYDHSVGAARITVDASGNTTINAIAGGTTSTAAVGGGYMGIPQNSTTTGAYTVAAADAGKHIYSSATRTITINSNANLSLPIGTTLTFISGAGATTTIAITTDTMYLAGSGTTGSRTLAAYGIATAVKISSTSWIISGNGLT